MSTLKNIRLLRSDHQVDVCSTLPCMVFHQLCVLQRPVIIGTAISVQCACAGWAAGDVFRGSWHEGAQRWQTTQDTQLQGMSYAALCCAKYMCLTLVASVKVIFQKTMKMTQALVLSCKEVCLKNMHVHCQEQLVPIYMHSHTLTGVM